MRERERLREKLFSYNRPTAGVVGLLYDNECGKHSKESLYLSLAGMVALSLVGTLLMQLLAHTDSPRRHFPLAVPLLAIDVLLTVFLFVWYIAGEYPTSIRYKQSADSRVCMKQ